MDTSYGWNGASRLTQIKHDQGAANLVTIDLSLYNPAGQIERRAVSNDAFAYSEHANVNRGYTVDGLNRVTKVAGVSTSHNARGDLTGDTAMTYAYDADDRLVSAGPVSLEHDPAGRLFRETDTSSDLRFVYAGAEVIGEASANGVIRRRYVPGPAMDEPLVWYAGTDLTDPRWLLADERGSVIGRVNASGALSVNTYDEFGVPGTGNDGRYAYTGQIRLPEAGVYHYKARDYHPGLGRFLQPDPIGYAGGLNLYAYVLNDPLNLVDPFGLATKSNGCPGTGCPKPKPNDTADPGTEVEAVVVTGSRIYLPPGFTNSQLALIHGDLTTQLPGSDLGGIGGRGTKENMPKEKDLACQAANALSRWSRQDADVAFGSAGVAFLGKSRGARITTRFIKGATGVSEVFGTASLVEGLARSSPKLKRIRRSGSSWRIPGG